jgi:adenylate cyclase
VLGPEYLDRIVSYPGIIANRPELEEQAVGIGTVNTLPEIDGVNRRIPLIATIDGKLYPSLSMETLRVLAQDTTVQVKLNELGVEKMRIPRFGPISTDNLGRIWIDWSQRSKSVSAVDLPNDFGGAVVIVGVTAAGIGNPVPTPIGAVWPSDVQAAVLATMTNGVVIQRPVWADTAEILTLAVLGVILIFLTKWTYVGIIFGIVSIFGTIASSHYLFIQNLWLGDCVYISGALIIVMLHSYTVKFVAEYLAKLQIKKQFGSYVNPTIVERLQKNPELIKLGGERKELSIVMTDLRGFTALGESFGDDVEGLTQIMNDYMTALSIPVFKNDGTLIKFIGDASLHVHGAPLDDVNHAKTAVRTALDMIKAIDEFNIELTAKGRPPVGMGAGVNTGETLIGNIGSKTKFGYDVLGDSVSTAARLEGQTKGYGVLLIIGPKTAELIRDEIPVFELDCIAVKGKTIGLKIYTPAEDSVGHRDFLKHYYAGDWNRALQMIEYCKKQHPDMAKYYDVMTLRLKAGKPTNWAGVYHATSK